ncbi:MAG: murein L,D-transpeptidase catalytic domain family protein [Cyclobacteriaceae bacterium]
MRKSLLLLTFAFAFLSFSYKNLPAVNAGYVPEVKSVQRTVFLKTHGNVSMGLTRLNFEDSIRNLYNKIQLASYGLDYTVFRLGMIGYYSLENEGALSDKNIITIIDFSKPSTEKRFYTVDLEQFKVKYHAYVAHGINTGDNMATVFSNRPNSNQSSMGFYVTGETYVGSKGYSLRLDGKDKAYNDKIRSRAVVIHEADYVSENWIQRYGRLGRSQGCPALPKEISRDVIDTIKDNTAIFAYYPDTNYLTSSQYLKVENLMNSLEEKTLRLVGRNTKAQS